jgi:adenylate cyclase
LPAPGRGWLDAQLADLRLGLSMPRTRDTRVVIVDVDEASLQRLGRWPWSRARAQLVRELTGRQQAAVLGLDALFAEPEAGLSGPASGGDPAPDDELARALAGAPVVLGYYFSSDATRGVPVSCRRRWRVRRPGPDCCTGAATAPTWRC